MYDVPPVPWDNLYVNRWTLAGCSSWGIIYAVSFDRDEMTSNLLQAGITIWSYNSIQDCWKIIATCERSTAQENEWPFLMAATYNENSGRVSVFLELQDSTAFIYRFFV